jgi:hypothetical protein
VHRVLEQVPDRDLALALEVGWTRLERDHVRLPQLELRGVLDRDDPLVVGNERRQHVEGRRLARAGTAGDEEVEPGLDADLEELEHLGRRRAETDEVVDGERRRRELSDGDDGTDERERLDDRVHAGAVGQPGVHSRARLVDAPSERADDAVDDPHHVLVVEERAVDALDLAAALDVDVVRPVDHDLGDGLVVEQRLERPEARHVVDHLVDKGQPFVARDGEAVLGDHPVHEPADLQADIGRRDVDQRVEFADHLGLEAQPDLPQHVLARRRARQARRRRRSDRHGRSGRDLGCLLRPFDPPHQRHDFDLPRAVAGPGAAYGPPAGRPSIGRTRTWP